MAQQHAPNAGAGERAAPPPFASHFARPPGDAPPPPPHPQPPPPPLAFAAAFARAPGHQTALSQKLAWARARGRLPPAPVGGGGDDEDAAEQLARLQPRKPPVPRQPPRPPLLRSAPSTAASTGDAGAASLGASPATAEASLLPAASGLPTSLGAGASACATEACAAEESAMTSGGVDTPAAVAPEPRDDMGASGAAGCGASPFPHEGLTLGAATLPEVAPSAPQPLGASSPAASPSASSPPLQPPGAAATATACASSPAAPPAWASPAGHTDGQRDGFALLSGRVEVQRDGVSAVSSAVELQVIECGAPTQPCGAHAAAIEGGTAAIEGGVVADDDAAVLAGRSGGAAGGLATFVVTSPCDRASWPPAACSPGGDLASITSASEPAGCASPRVIESAGDPVDAESACERELDSVLAQLTFTWAHTRSGGGASPDRHDATTPSATAPPLAASAASPPVRFCITSGEGGPPSGVSAPFSLDGWGMPLLRPVCRSLIVTNPSGDCGVRLAASLEQYEAPCPDEGPVLSTTALTSAPSASSVRWRRRSSLGATGDLAAAAAATVAAPPCVSPVRAAWLQPRQPSLSDSQARAQVTAAQALTGCGAHRGFTAPAGVAHAAARADAVLVRRVLSRGAGFAITLQPRVLALPPHGCAVLTLTAVANMPGRYTDTLTLTPLRRAGDVGGRGDGAGVFGGGAGVLGGGGIALCSSAAPATTAQSTTAANSLVGAACPPRVFSCTLEAQAVGCALRLQPHTLGLTLWAPGGARVTTATDTATEVGTKPPPAGGLLDADLGLLDFGVLPVSPGSTLRRVTVANTGRVDVTLTWRVLPPPSGASAGTATPVNVATATATSADADGFSCCHATLSWPPAPTSELEARQGEAAVACSAPIVRLRVLPYAGAGSSFAEPPSPHALLPSCFRVVAPASHAPVRIAAGGSAVVAFTCVHPHADAPTLAACDGTVADDTLLARSGECAAALPAAAPAAGGGRVVCCSLVADAEWAAPSGRGTVAAAARECELGAIVLRAVAVLL